MGQKPCTVCGNAIGRRIRCVFCGELVCMPYTERSTQERRRKHAGMWSNAPSEALDALSHARRCYDEHYRERHFEPSGDDRSL
jgi:hypothetical protein